MTLLQSKAQAHGSVSNLPKLHQCSANKVELQGDLTLDSSHLLLQPGLAAISALASAGGQQWLVDCRHVGVVSSAAVSLLLQWWRACQTHKLQLQLENLPQQLLPLMSISEVEPLMADCIASINHSQ